MLLANMTTIGFIGSGNIGGTVAHLAVAAGYQVVMSNSRGPETLVDLVDDLGDGARAGTVADAARAGDLVVVSIPFGRFGEVPADLLDGKIVMDTNNYYAQRDGDYPDIDSGSVTSSELLQRHLAGARVVKVFNNILYRHLRELARRTGASDRSALAIAGDDAAAKAAVTAFLDKIGYDAYDVGPLREGWRYEPDRPAYGAIYLGPLGFDGPGQPADSATVKMAIEAAAR
jgi:8-hydroxy-5-deazaflavin:NADPH oxidoreductase